MTIDGESPRGPGEPHLVVLFGAREKSYTLPQGEVIVGKGPRLGVTIESPNVSTQHCRIERKRDRCWIEDLGSADGTYVNGQRIDRLTELQNGSLIHIGEVCLRYLAGNEISKHLSTILVRGNLQNEIDTSGEPLMIGRAPECGVILPNTEISPHHARMENLGDGPVITALNEMGECRINGRHFDRHRLIFGDQLELGPFRFQFDGNVLQLLESDVGASLVGEDLTIVADSRRILDRISLNIEANEFVGIIGPTGAGKSTLMSALSGMHMAQAGKVLVNGKDLYANLNAFRSEFGWVPQQDIVHKELTVVQALSYAAKLRLPRDTPRMELARLVLRIASQLGLERYMGTPIRQLSGGETKKVSVAAELLSRPHVLFLDEPTSGLDPGAEERLMEILRQLADSGCTVVCTTHVMQSVYLLDRLVVLSDGMLIFSGPPDEAKEFFGVRDPGAIFMRISERRASDWREAFLSYRAQQGEEAPPAETPSVMGQRKKRPVFQIPFLLARQWALLRSDWRNSLIIFGQPLLIALLILWAVNGTTDDSSLRLFFIYIATLWFGCSNAAQEIVAEMPIYHRERLVGLHRGSYVFAKWLFLSAVTIVQAALVYGIAGATDAGTELGIAWQILGLAMISLTGTGLGLAISAFARSPMQAVLLVPLLLIPQIILSGFTVPAAVMTPSVLAVSQVVPTFQLQRLMDLSLLWKETIDAKTLQDHLQAFQNLNIDSNLKIGDVVTEATPAWFALGALGAWIIGLFVFVLVALYYKERQRR